MIGIEQEKPPMKCFKTKNEKNAENPNKKLITLEFIQQKL